MPIGLRNRAASCERPGHAEVDQPRRPAHHDVARLDVEVDDALGGQVVQCRRDVESERQQLLERERAVGVQQLGERRPVEMLEHEVGEPALELGAEPAHDDGVRELREQLGLAGEVAQRVRLARLVGAQDLRHEHRQAVLVPHEHGLVAAPAADPAQDGPPGCELVALLEPPGRARTARGGPRRRRGDGGVAHLIRRPA